MVEIMAPRMEGSSGRISLKSKQQRRSRGRVAGKLRAYEFDSGTGDVLKNGLRVKRLTRQEAKLLLLLVSNAPEVVSRKTIEVHLWRPPDESPPDDTEQSINDLVQRLRAILSDSPEKAEFIETVRGIGYRFVGLAGTAFLEESQAKPAAVQPPPSDVSQMGEGVAAVPREEREVELVTGSDPPVKVTTGTMYGIRKELLLSRRGFWMALAVIVGLTACGYAWHQGWPQRQPSHRQARRLIPNAAERRILTAAISPDGKYLAYADEAGAYILVIGSGETNPLQTSAGELILNISWFPDSIRLILVAADGAATSLREATILNGKVTAGAIQKDVGETAVSPDGAQVAYTNRLGTSLYVQHLGTGERRKMISVGDSDDDLRNPSWADNEKLIIGRVHFGGPYTVSIDLLNTVTGSVEPQVSNPNIRSGYATPAGRLLYSTVDSDGTSIYEAAMDLVGSKLKSPPILIQSLPQTTIYMLSASSDGRNVAYLQGPYQADAFVSELRGADSNIRRVTLDDSNDLPTAWYPDGRAIAFHSDRNGHWEIFAQTIGQTRADVLVTGPDDYKGARFTADGKWLLYLAYPRTSKSRLPILAEVNTAIANLRVHVMRMPASGGNQQSMTSGFALSFRCASAKDSKCIVCERGIAGGLTFSELDPEFGRTDTSLRMPDVSQAYWDVSPDGSELAMASTRGKDGLIRRIKIQDGSSHEILVKNQPHLQSMDWMQNGNGWIVSSRWTHGAELLYVDQEGRQTILRRQSVGFETWGLPNRDGTRFAFLEWSATGSPWLLPN